MKKIFFYLTLTLAFTACSNIEDDTDNVIEYNAVAARSTTKVDGSVYPTDLPFISFAFNYDSQYNWADVKETLDAESATYIKGAEIIYDEDGDNIYLPGSWHSTKIYFWPKTDKLAFFSYSPASFTDGLTCTPATGIKVTGYDVDSNPNTDFMVADLQADLEKQTVNSPVPTVFRHKLCKVYFTVISYKYNQLGEYLPYDYAGGHTEANLEDKDYLITLKKIEIKNIYNKADYNGINTPYDNTTSVTDSWTPVGNKKNYVMFDGSMQVDDEKSLVLSTVLNKYFMPQVFGDDAKLVVSYTVKHGETVTPVEKDFVLSTLGKTSSTDYIDKWQMNKIYTYNLRFDLGSDVITWAPEIFDWEDVDAGIVQIEVPNGQLNN